MATRLFTIASVLAVICAPHPAAGQARHAEEKAITQRLEEYYVARSRGDATLAAFFTEDVDMRLSSTATTIQNGRAAVIQRFQQVVGQPAPRLKIQKMSFITDELALVDATLDTDVNGGTTSYSYYVMVKQDGVWRFRALRAYQLPTPK